MTCSFSYGNFKAGFSIKASKEVQKTANRITIGRQLRQAIKQVVFDLLISIKFNSNFFQENWETETFAK
ncbi:hypothetical protein [uncultured Oscillibacter sp.]|uniref:hypothetical protein n=1 Tax=uncultured Oscillibacter sp. TaxID=876091 RepID=UPI0025E9384E|nr:hypothetical protein [uncultured Oscillibacter sp.]